jgi:IQ calmodulin-binding motif
MQAERRRLAAMEDAQRETAVLARRAQAERAARRHWARRDDAAVTLQRVFRGHLGRRRALIMRQVRVCYFALSHTTVYTIVMQLLLTVLQCCEELCSRNAVQ